MSISLKMDIKNINEWVEMVDVNGLFYNLKESDLKENQWTKYNRLIHSFKRVSSKKYPSHHTSNVKRVNSISSILKSHLIYPSIIILIHLHSEFATL